MLTYAHKCRKCWKPCAACGFNSGPYIRWPDQVLVYSDAPAWKRLIDLPLTTDERVSLITTIFSDHDETEVVRWLRGDDAQSFVDVIDEVLHRSCIPKESSY